MSERASRESLVSRLRDSSDAAYEWDGSDPKLVRYLATDLAEAADRIEQLETALNQHGHVVDIQETRFGLEHPVECREAGLLECPVDAALTALDGSPRSPGRYRVSLNEHGILNFVAVNS